METLRVRSAVPNYYPTLAFRVVVAQSIVLYTRDQKQQKRQKCFNDGIVLAICVEKYPFCNCTHISQWESFTSFLTSKV